MRWPSARNEQPLHFVPEIFTDRKREAQNWLSNRYPRLFPVNHSGTHTNAFSAIQFALFGLFRFSIKIFRDGLISLKSDNLFPRDGKFAIVFDLTRQHLPPAITVNELDEFFFDSDRNLLDSETRSMVLIIQSSKVNAQLTHRLISSPSISHLVFGSKASRGSKIYVLIKALIKTITSISLDRNFLNTAGILHDIFEVNLLREGNFHERINFVFVTNSSFYNFPSIFYLERKNSTLYLFLKYSYCRLKLL